MFAGLTAQTWRKSGTSASHSSPCRRTTPHHGDANHGPSVHLMSGEWMISRRACFMPSLGRFKEIFWNQDSLTRQGGPTTWGPRLFRIQALAKCQPPFLLRRGFHALRLAAVRMPGQFSGSRKCNHGIFPRLSAPLGAAPRQDIINGARKLICCSGSSLDKRSRRPSLPSQPSHVIGLLQTHSVHGFPRSLRLRLMSCLLPIRPHWIQGLSCTAGEGRCVSSFASHLMLCILLACGRPVVIDTSIFFPGGWEI